MPMGRASVDVRACQACGAVVADEGRHAVACPAIASELAPHTGDAVLDFIDALDPDELEAGMLSHAGGLTGGENSVGACAIRWLREQAVA